MSYGYFDDERREYVITNPKTPVKWINYIGTLRFGGFVDHTGGSLLCKGDPELNRITRYIPQLPAADFRGETLYVRVTRNGQASVYSPFFVPCLIPQDRYECRVGPGYQRIISEYAGVRTDVTIFVPPDEDVAIRDILVTNISENPLEIDLIPVVEYTHPDALKQFTNADWVPQTMQSKALRLTDQRIILLQYPFMFRDTKVNFFAASAPVSSFETDRRMFLGDNEYGSWRMPLSLEEDQLPCTEATRGDNIGALMIRPGRLDPGESRRITVLLGQTTTPERARRVVETFCDPAAVDRAFARLREFWDGYLSGVRVSTPDPDFDRMVNIHNPRQCYITKQWSRYLSLYQLGFGARGIGFRDSCQDLLGVMDRVAPECVDLLRMLLSIQKRDGSAMHQFNPMTMIATEGDSREREDRPHYYGDDHLWAVLAVTRYVKETGDAGFLDRQVPFYDKDRSGNPLEQASVLDHLRRACAFTKNNCGAHGLPLLGFADWNDTVNLPTGAESMFIANLYGLVLREMVELSEFLDDSSAADGYGRDYEEMNDAFNRHAWDGEWFLRYFDADGTPLGSGRNDHGRIYVNGQSWPVISGFASGDRARRALDSAYRLLNTRCGLKISWPGFNGFDPSKGGITTYPPGAKENGGIFLHTNPWMIIAEALMGNAERAWEYYRQINPASRNDRIDEFQCEPYVYPQNILGDEHPLFGLARNSWLSGTASWAYQAAFQYLLGIRPGYRGLTVSPCIPSGWEGFRVQRTFRGAEFDIRVTRSGKSSTAGVALEVDGKRIGGTVIPLFAPGSEHQVEVRMV